MMRSTMLKSVGLVALAIGSVATATSGFAQESGAAGQTATVATNTPQAEASGLSDIVVTAQRRSETAQRAALAIDVVSAAELAGAGVVTTATLNAAVPSLTVQQAGGANTTYFIRGVGNFTNNGYSDPAVAFNNDGVYLARTTSTTGTFYDLERVEVLKGPQGTLYGRNATGGAINVIPNRPRLGETSFGIVAGYGNYDARDLEANVNVALGANAALRVAGKIVDRDGYNTDGTFDEKGQAVRAQLLFEPSSALRIRVAADFAHQGGNGISSDYLGTEQFTPGSPATATSPANYTLIPANLGKLNGSFTPAARAYFSKLVIPGTFNNPAPLVYPYLDNTYYGVLTEITADSGIGTFTLLPAYRRSNLNNLFNGPSFQAAMIDENDTQFSVEARLQGKRVGIFDWLVGLYYFHEKVDAVNSISQYQITSFQDFTTHTNSYAAFGRVTANLSDTLRLVAGGRYTKDKKDFNAAVQTLVNLCTVAPPPVGPGCFGGPSTPVVRTLADVPGGPTMPGFPGARPFGNRGNILFFTPNNIDVSLDKGRFTYRLAAEYDVGPRSLLYASYETGYRSGGFATGVGRETFAPEYVNAVTLGSKNRFFDNRVQLNVEAFYWKYRDQQVSHFGIDRAGNSNFFTENIGRSTIKGIDVEAQFLATANTLFNATVQYLDAKTKEFGFLVPRGGTNLPPVTGCAVSNTTEGAALRYLIDCSGKRAYNSPRWSINAGVAQTIPFEMTKIVLSGESRYRSNSVNGFDYLPQNNTGDYWMFDASASFGDIDDRWSATGYVRNITDRKIRTLTQFAGTTGNSLTTTYTPPRTYGVRVSYKF